MTVGGGQGSGRGPLLSGHCSVLSALRLPVSRLGRRGAVYVEVLNEDNCEYLFKHDVISINGNVSFRDVDGSLVFSGNSGSR